MVQRRDTPHSAKRSWSLPSEIQSFRTVIKKYAKVSLAQFVKLLPHPFLFQSSSLSVTDELSLFATAEIEEGPGAEDFTLVDSPIFFVTSRNPAMGPQAWVTVGRADNNDLVINNPSISKFHAYFKEENGTWFLCDHGSRNGTYINKIRMPPKKPTELTSKTEITFAENPTFHFVSAEDTYHYVQGLSRIVDLQ